MRGSPLYVMLPTVSNENLSDVRRTHITCEREKRKYLTFYILFVRLMQLESGSFVFAHSFARPPECRIVKHKMKINWSTSISLRRRLLDARQLKNEINKILQLKGEKVSTYAFVYFVCDCRLCFFAIDRFLLAGGSGVWHRVSKCFFAFAELIRNDVKICRLE